MSLTAEQVAQEREKFEAWLKSRGASAWKREGEYVDSMSRLWWECWQAALSQPKADQPASPAVEPVAWMIVDLKRRAIGPPIILTSHPAETTIRAIQECGCKLVTLYAAPPAPVAIPTGWEPQFDVMVHEQEKLVIKFCEEIAGKKGNKPSLPDPVRLLEMAHELYLAERNDLAAPLPECAAQPQTNSDKENVAGQLAEPDTSAENK